jgi:hypothetical protein
VVVVVVVVVVDRSWLRLLRHRMHWHWFPLWFHECVSVRDANANALTDSLFTMR